MSTERTFANSVASIGRARRFAVDALRDADPEVVDAVAVMVSELATNSVRHAASDFVVSVDCDAELIRVAVADAGDRLPSLRTPEPGEHSGRGLQIVRALADEWGVSENVAGPGKTVWFVLATRASSAQRAGSTSSTSSSPRVRRPDPERTAARPPSSDARNPRRGGRAQARTRARRRCDRHRVACFAGGAIRVERRRDDGRL